MTLPDASSKERVIDLLTQSYTQDRLTEAELEARLDEVYGATTQAELDALVAGIPTTADPGTSQSTAVSRHDAQAGRVVALFSGHESKLVTVPHHLDVRARFGYVELDLRNATFPPGVTEIDVRAFAGYAKVYLPAGVRVESTGRGIFGFFAERGSGSTDADAPVVRLRGRALFGFVESWVSRRSP